MKEIFPFLQHQHWVFHIILYFYSLSLFSLFLDHFCAILTLVHVIWMNIGKENDRQHFVEFPYCRYNISLLKVVKKGNNNSKIPNNNDNNSNKLQKMVCHFRSVLRQIVISDVESFALHSKRKKQTPDVFIGQFIFARKSRRRNTPIHAKCFYISAISNLYIFLCGYFPLFSLFFKWLLNISGFYHHNSCSVHFVILFSFLKYVGGNGNWKKVRTLCPMERDCQQHHCRNCIHIDDNLCYYTEERCCHRLNSQYH